MPNKKDRDITPAQVYNALEALRAAGRFSVSSTGNNHTLTLPAVDYSPTLILRIDVQASNGKHHPDEVGTRYFVHGEAVSKPNVRRNTVPNRLSATYGVSPDRIGYYSTNDGTRRSNPIIALEAAIIAAVENINNEEGRK